MSVATQNVVATLRDVGGDLATSRGVVPEKTADGLLWRVPPGEAFSLRLPLTAEGQSHFAVSATVCVSNWDELVRVDLEADSGSKTYRTGAKHLIQGRWHELRLDSSSLAFGIANGWSPALPAIDTVSLHVLGTAAAETTFALRDLTVEVFDASDAVPRLLVDDELESLDDILSWYPAITGRSSDPVLQDYVFVREYKTLDADAVRLAEAMRSRSEYELRGVTTPVKVGPDGEPEGTPSASWRFGWQSLDMCFALVRAFKATRDHGYLMLAIDHVDSWLAANIGNEPVDDYYGWYDHGVALRALAMLTVVDVAIEERVDAERVAPLIRAIRDHSELLANESFNGFNQSQHFHNHTLFQAVSLLFVARNQLGFAESQRWSAVAEQRILDQLNGLLSSEGVAIENSTGYHRGIEDVAKTLTEVAEAYGLPVSEALGELAARMSAFTSAIAYPNGEFPPFGDTLHPRPNKLAELAQAYSPVAEVGPDRFFSHAGYAVLRSGEPGVSARQIGMICSSLETTHKHEDNLSFTFWADGIEWLTDPGLYGYNIEDEHGAYFRSAAAHSALVIEGQRYQADTGSAQMISWRGDREVAHVQAEHSAYPGVRMLRTLLLDKVQDAIFVADSCETNEQPGALELWFHAGAGVSAEVYPDGAVTLSAAGRPDAWSIVPLAPASTDVEVFSGATDPQLSGWIYPPNGPAPTRSIRFRSGDDRVWLTAIVPGPAPAGDRVEALRQLYNDHAGRLGLRS